MVERNFVAHKVNIYLDMLCALVLDGIGSEINGGDIVTVNKNGGRRRAVEFSEQLMEPGCFSHNISNNSYSTSSL